MAKTGDRLPSPHTWAALIAILLTAPAHGEVESTAPHLLYHPAIHYAWRDLQDSTALRPLQGVVNDAPVSSSLPEVNPPPFDVRDGKDPLAPRDWALRAIRMPSPEALAALPEHAPITVAVLDTGVDYNHEDLSGALWRSPEDSRVVGADFAHPGALPYDVAHFDLAGCLGDLACSSGIDVSKFLVNPGHGTHCAGHVGAVAGNSLGIRGVGAGARVMALKIFRDFGEENAGQADDAAAIQAIDFAIAHGAKVINASWATRARPDDAERSELKGALERARRAGVLVVVAAGNDAIDQDSDDRPDYPARYELDNLIAVAAVDADDELAGFSDFGARSVHIAAPGVRILSTTADGGYADVLATAKDAQGREREMDWDGTSMAAPLVSGAAALVWSRYPDEGYREIRKRILDTARKVPALSGKVASGGVLDVSAALALPRPR